MKKRLGKKLLGIGVPGFAFLGGAGFGFGVGLLSYSIYHRYQYIALQMVQRGFWDESKWNPEYYRTYYEKYGIASMLNFYNCICVLFLETNVFMAVPKILTVNGGFVNVIKIIRNSKENVTLKSLQL